MGRSRRGSRRPLSNAVVSVIVGMLAIAGLAEAKASQETHGTNAVPAQARPEQSSSTGEVIIEGHPLAYRAVAGTLILKNSKEKPTASIFYVAYFKKGGDAAGRPLTFLYNGGPGSSTIWLHMGAFGPRRVITADHTHSAPAPYRVVNNDYSLLDASDLVFIDAPGTGFSRLIGKTKKKEFYGVDADAKAFTQFIVKFLSKYGRWNSPKYLFGESYGTTRSAVLARFLETRKDIDLNGVILLSQILCFDNSVDDPEDNPGIDLPYELALPTYAATAWYHHKLPGPRRKFEELLKEVERFATGPYAQALAAGAALSSDEKQAIAHKLHEYTGLPVAYVEKADLRVNGGEFEKNLQDAADLTTGRLDTRFSGPTMDPLSKEAAYDPQGAAISSAYVAAFNDYVRKVLKFGRNETYRPEWDLWKSWDFRHKPPGADRPVPEATNVMPDLAAAMKYNPDLKVLVNAGYFDLATPFYAAVYEIHHLPMPPKLLKNIQFAFYHSGHMVYVHQPALKQLHDKVARFIRQTDHAGH